MSSTTASAQEDAGTGDAEGDVGFESREDAAAEERYQFCAHAALSFFILSANSVSTIFLVVGRILFG